MVFWYYKACKLIEQKLLSKSSNDKESNKVKQLILLEPLDTAAIEKECKEFELILSKSLYENKA